MIGILIITETTAALEHIKSLERLMGNQSALVGLALSSDTSFESMKNSIENSLKQINLKQVLVFNDLWGSTQARASQCFLKKGSVESIYGYNFPMLLKSLSLRNSNMGLEEFIDALMSYGTDHIWHINDASDRPKC